MALPYEMDTENFSKNKVLQLKVTKHSMAIKCGAEPNKCGTEPNVRIAGKVRRTEKSKKETAKQNGTRLGQLKDICNYSWFEYFFICSYQNVSRAN